MTEYDSHARDHQRQTTRAHISANRGQCMARIARSALPYEADTSVLRAWKKVIPDSLEGYAISYPSCFSARSTLRVWSTHEFL